MDADLDTLCTVVYGTADDLLPEARADARRKVTDAEVVTLCVAQAIMGIPSDRRFLRTARRQVRADQDGVGPHLAQIRQRIESIFWTTKDLLALERHGARTTAGLRERIAVRFLCLAACISLNHRLGRPSRALVSYCA